MRSPILLVLSLFSLSFIGQALQYRGADFSSVINLENSGVIYKDSKSAPGAKLETILENYGTNLARIRIFTSNDDTHYSLTYGLALAKRAVAAGMDLLINLHYSDTWTDPGDQAIPSSWPTDLTGLNHQIYTYTKDLVKSFVDQGTPIKFIELGNEINDGMLWPVGRPSVNGYSSLSQLLHSAASGVRAASSTTKTVVHLSNAGDENLASSFYSGIFIAGQLSISDIDTMGFSFYPYWEPGATFDALRSTLQAMVTKYGKDVMVVETNWPVTCPGVTLSDTSIPVSVDGQIEWVSGLKTVLEGLSGGHGTGIVYFEPAWIGNPRLDSSCADNLLVDGSGTTRRSISMFSNSTM